MTEYLEHMWALASEGEAQGVFFFAAVYVVLVLAWSLVYQLRVAAWPVTRGRLIAAGVRRFGATDIVRARQDYVVSAEYEYTVGGTTYRGKRLSPWLVVASHNLRAVLRRQVEQVRRDAEGAVDVYYDPRRPQRSFLLKPGPVGIACTAALAVAVPLLYWVKYHG